MRWDLIDRFEILKKGRYSKAVKSFSGDEDFFSEHHPGRPRVPEPLFVEMIAQSGGVIFGLGFDFEKEVVLAKITKAVFSREVAPPCRLEVEATIVEESEDGARVAGIVRLEGETVAEAEILLFAIEDLGLGDRRKIVFNEHFMNHYDVLNVAKASEA